MEVIKGNQYKTSSYLYIYIYIFYILAKRRCSNHDTRINIPEKQAKMIADTKLASSVFIEYIII